MDLIKLENLAKYYKSGTGVSRGIQNVNLTFNLNEFVVVSGESGGGKTTLLNVVAGLDTFEEGEMFFNGEATSSFQTKDWESYRSNYVGFVFQNYNIIDSLSVYQNVLLALEVQNYDARKRRARAIELIKEVGLYNRRKSRAIKLSGGEKQRLSIARALAKDSTILVCDEPTGNLDSETGRQIIDLIYRVSKGKLVILVSHNLDQVKDYATKIVTIHDGNVNEVRELKKVEKEEIVLISKKHKVNIKGLLNLSSRMLLQTPKRFIFVLFFHLIVSFVLMYLLTNSIYSINSNSYMFPNYHSPADRLEISKRDGSNFTLSEVEELRGYSEIIGVYTDPDRFQVSSYGFNHVFYSISTTNSIIPHFLEGRLPQANNEVVISPSQYTSYNNLVIGNYISLTINGNTSNYKVVGKYNSNFTGIIYVNENILTGNVSNIEKLLVIVNDPINVRMMINKLNNNHDNLRIIFNYDNSPFANFDTIFTTINVVFQVFMIIVFGTFLYSLVFTITKNTMATKRKDIAILRSIGYTRTDMGISTLFEQLYLMIISFILSMVLLYLISVNNFSFYLSFNYLKGYHFILFIAILLFLTVRLSNKYNHRLFNLSIIENLVQVGEEVWLN